MLILIDDYEKMLPYETETETVTEMETQTSVVYFDGEEVTEIVTENSELSQMFTDISELNEYAAVLADNTTSIKQQTVIEVILLFAVIAFCGLISGLLVTHHIRK